MNTLYHKNTRTTTLDRDSVHNLERELKIRGFSPKTISSYLTYNRLFLEFSKKSPREITNDDVRAYLESIKDKGHTNSTLNVAHSTP